MLVEPWKIEMFGRLSVRQADRVITRFQTQKTAALFAYLAYFTARRHPREELVERFWPEAEPEAGRMSLRTALASLRRQLEPPGVPSGSVLVADRASVHLNPAAVSVDVAQFQVALQAAAKRASEEQAPLLAEAVEIYQGDLLPGFYEDWVLSERERQADAYLGALRQLTRLLAQARDFHRALEYARRAVSADPLREEAHRNLMRLYVAVGRPAAALQQYAEMECLLREKLGVEPSEATRALAQELQAGVPRNAIERVVREAAEPNESASAAPLPPLPSSAPPAPIAPRLPLQFTRFFGREPEVDQLLSLLLPGDPASRLLTLTGPGGTGKTRLAIEIANRLQERFANAVWFVPLADLTDARLIGEAILDALRLEGAPNTDPLEQAIGFLQPRPALLVLDNFEQLVETGSLVVKTLLAQTPLLTCLVTSRQRLDIGGERELALPPLPIPDSTGTPERLLALPSVALFVDRAQAHRPDFQVTRGNAAAVAALCRRLEGIPLALELTAAWAQMLTPAQMLERLMHRFDLLVSRRKDMEERHRSLHAAIEWSYLMLPPDLQRFFARLSVFRGGWTIEAAQAVCGPPPVPLPTREGELRSRVIPFPTSFTSHTRMGNEGLGAGALDSLLQLQERSLLVAEEAAGEMRFRLLETLREFAGDQLSEEDYGETIRRSIAYYLALAEESATKLRGREEAVWLDRLEREHDNFRAALEACLHDPKGVERGLQLAGALGQFWIDRGHLREGGEWYARILAHSGAEAPTPARARALHAAGGLAINRGDGDAAERLYEESLEIYAGLGELAGKARVLNSIGWIAQQYSQFDRAERLYQESLEIYRAQNDTYGIANTLSNLGWLALSRNEIDQARALQEEALVLRKSLGDRSGIGNCLRRLGSIAAIQGDPAEAVALFSESLKIARELSNKPDMIVSLLNLAVLERERENEAPAIAALTEGLELSWELGDSYMIYRALEQTIHLAVRKGQPERAARLLGAISGEEMVDPEEASYRAERERALAAAQEALAADAFQAAFAAGRAMTELEAVACALDYLRPSPSP